MDIDQKNLPKISIITPVLNAIKTFEKAVNSVIYQQYPHVEHIIIDGGSTDGTLELIHKYEKYIAYWSSEKDNSAAKAVNKGIKLASGEIICLLFSDDWYEPNTLHCVGECFMRDPELQLVTTGVKIAAYDNKQRISIIKYYTEKKLFFTLENILFCLPLIGGRFFRLKTFKL